MTSSRMRQRKSKMSLEQLVMQINKAALKKQKTKTTTKGKVCIGQSTFLNK